MTTELDTPQLDVENGKWEVLGKDNEFEETKTEDSRPSNTSGGNFLKKFKLVTHSYPNNIHSKVKGMIVD